MAKQPLGAVLIHGFSSTPKGLGNLAHQIEQLGLPYRAPTLRGHGLDSPDALKGVRWRDWITDAEQAIADILEETEKVSVIGHSLGGMIATFLAIENKVPLDSIIVTGGATVSNSPVAPGRPLHFLAPLVPLFQKRFAMNPEFADPALIRLDISYPWVPTGAWLPVMDLIKEIRKRMPEVTVPTLILHGKKDPANLAAGAQMLYDSISTPAAQKQLIWFEKTKHSMFLDCEAEEVIQAVVDYLKGRLKQNQ